MSNIKTVFEIKTFAGSRGKKKYPAAPPKMVTINSIGQKAATEIDKEYNPRLTSKVLKGFMINDKFVPVDLENHWDRAASIPVKP